MICSQVYKYIYSYLKFRIDLNFNTRSKRLPRINYLKNIMRHLCVCCYCNISVHLIIK